MGLCFKKPAFNLVDSPNLAGLCYFIEELLRSFNVNDRTWSSVLTKHTNPLRRRESRRCTGKSA